MQEEVENRTVNLAISTTKLTFRTIVNGYNAWKRHHQAKVAQKTAQLPVGKQSIKELIGQNQGVSSIPIEKTDLKGFEQVARKYGVDYAITKDQNVMPPKYTVFFKAKDSRTSVRKISSYPLKCTGPIVKSMCHRMEDWLGPVVELPHVPVFFSLRKMGVGKHKILLWCNFFLIKIPLTGD